jgi:allophanate hydrolase
MDLGIEALKAAYAAGATSPTQIIAQLYPQCSAAKHVFLHLVPKEELLQRCAELEKLGPADLPLYGVPFAVKDNVDVAGMPSTAACPAFSYTPQSSAPAVAALLQAGARPSLVTPARRDAPKLLGYHPAPQGA